MITEKDIPPSVQKAIERVDREFQTKTHVWMDRAPFANEIPNQGVVFATVSGTSYLYTRRGDQRYRVALTAV